jgi:uncharacterized protein (TIGR02996 family)
VTEAQLVRAILDAPDDDGPREVYADWLTERGDPRGELVSLSLAQSRLVVSSPRWTEMELLIRERMRFAPAPVIPELPRAVWGLRRGVYEAVSNLGVGALLRHEDRLTAAAPFLRDLKLERLDVQELTSLLSSGIRLDILRLPAARPGVVAALALSPRARTLRGLALSGVKLSATDLGLLRAEHFPALSELALGSTDTQEDGVRILAQNGGLGLVRSLRLAGEPLGTDGCRQLARHAPATLRLLDLSRARVGFHGVLQLLKLRGLEELDLSRCPIGDVGCAELARSRQPLRGLRLSAANIFDDGARRLAEAPFASTLELLDLRDNKLGAEAARVLRARFGDRVLV